MIRFVIPAYNEQENIPGLLADLGPVARELGARVIFVDDGSTDGTSAAIEEHGRGLPLAIVRHQVNRGLGTAINSGLRAALGESQDDDAIVTLEADNTSDLKDLPRMLQAFHGGDDVVLASVYAPGGRILGVAPWRLAASKSVSNVFRYAGGLREIHTLSSLYRVYRAGTLRKASETYGYLLVREPGFAANVELLLKLYNAGAKVSEVPTVNDWSRRLGNSKMSLRPTVLAYGRLMAAHLVGRIQPPPISPLGNEPPASDRGHRDGTTPLRAVAGGR
jgi:dolichol-phosphate mannosyltransferase